MEAVFYAVRGYKRPKVTPDTVTKPECQSKSCTEAFPVVTQHPAHKSHKRRLKAPDTSVKYLEPALTGLTASL
jgi:hypothetical protein